MTSVWSLVAQAAPAVPAQHAWLKGFEGTWIVDGARGSDAGMTLTIVRDGNALVLKAVRGDREVVTRYDLTGADATNSNIAGTRIFRTRIVGQKLATEIWEKEAVGPPARIETRYLESADRMGTELSRTAGGPAFNRTVLRHK